MKKINPVWLHRIIRVTGGLAFIILATQYKDSWPLYGFGGIFLVTAFIKPRRCYGSCETGAAATYADGNKK